MMKRWDSSDKNDLVSSVKGVARWQRVLLEEVTNTATSVGRFVNWSCSWNLYFENTIHFMGFGGTVVHNQYCFENEIIGNNWPSFHFFSSQIWSDGWTIYVTCQYWATLRKIFNLQRIRFLGPIWSTLGVHWSTYYVKLVSTNHGYNEFSNLLGDLCKL